MTDLSTQDIQRWHTNMNIGIPDWYELAGILLKRLEAASELPANWREWSALSDTPKSKPAAECVGVCADELEQALKGES